MQFSFFPVLSKQPRQKEKAGQKKSIEKYTFWGIVTETSIDLVEHQRNCPEREL